MASVPGGRGPKSTCAWTCASAFSPENSSQIFARESCRDWVWARSHATERPTARSSPAHRRAGPMLRLARGQTERDQDALQIIVTVIFDLDGAPFLPVMHPDSGPEMLLQSILQVLDRGGGKGHGARLPFAPGPHRAELARDEAFGGADRRAAAQDRFRYRQLFRRLLQAEEDLGVSHREQALGQPGLHLFMQIQQAHRIGHCGAASANLLGNVFLAQPEFIRQPEIRARFLDWIEVGALQIFDQRKFQDLKVGGDAGDHRDLDESRFLCCPPAAFSGNQFMPAAYVPNDQRLDNSMLPN